MRDRALAMHRDPGGRRRQPRAVRAADDRTARLRQIRVPTIVIHGTVDPICHRPAVRQRPGHPGARLELIDGMGYDLPPGAWPQIVGAIADNARRADAAPTT